MIFFSADSHFGHLKICEYANRPFSSVEEMDEAMITRWNTVVSKADTVYHLGDFTLGDDAGVYLSRLHGKIKFVIPDFHHDKRWLANKPDLPNVEYLPPVISVKINEIIIALCHFPLERWDRQHYGSLHFHGHSHAKLPITVNRLDIGVDEAYRLLGEYRPFSLQETIDVLRDRIV